MYLTALQISGPVVLRPRMTDHSLVRCVILPSEGIARGERRGAETLRRCTVANAARNIMVSDKS
jgi:hypothetical protein